MSDFRLSVAMIKQSVTYISACLPKVALLKTSLMEFMAWTWGSCSSSFPLIMTGVRAISWSLTITESRVTSEEPADNIPVMSPGRPAERLVVECCSLMHWNARYNGLVCDVT